MLKSVRDKAFKIILPQIELTEVCSITERGGNAVRITVPGSGEQLIYTVRPTTNTTLAKYYHFPIVLQADSSPWKHATLYLLQKIDSIAPPNPRTLESIANDLVMFRRFLDDEKIDYLHFPKRKLRRPTYHYRTQLQQLMESGEISANTASRRVSSVIGFYRWLERQHDTSFEHPLWQESEISISFHNTHGSIHHKPVKTTDLSVHVPKNREDYSEYINDSGKRRPLDKSEQVNLVTALKNIGNPEMMLAFLVALTSGARLQTVFTLRLVHFQTKLPEQLSEIPILVGMGTSIDTKFQRRMTLYIPRWLQEKIMVYINSERALKRRKISSHTFNNIGDQYVFLTRTGKPYYIANNDPFKINYRSPPRGGSVRQFIKSQLKPELIKLDAIFEFRFHDLRATYGLNLLEEKLSQSGEKNSLFTSLMFIKTRMGHSKLSTTEHYLEYRKKYKLATHIQSEFEQHLVEVLQGGDDDE
jgi:integrase